MRDWWASSSEYLTNGKNATNLSIEGNEVVIRRMSQDLNNLFGSRRNIHRFPISSITGIEFEEPNLVTEGFIRFKYPGSDDEDNTVYFRNRRLNEFLDLKERIESSPAPAPSRVKPNSGVDKISHPKPNRPTSDGNSSSQGDEVVDQIRKLGQLRDEGLLTEDEFTQAKSRLLNP